jgi:hypothetical protein
LGIDGRLEMRGERYRLGGDDSGGISNAYVSDLLLFKLPYHYPL